jgi:hypothetical protein
MRMLFWVGAVAGLTTWIITLRRRLHAAQMRGDMYRDIAVRLDRQIVELHGRGIN